VPGDGQKYDSDEDQDRGEREEPLRFHDGERQRAEVVIPSLTTNSLRSQKDASLDKTSTLSKHREPQILIGITM
jgi:hypothetical protein